MDAVKPLPKRPGHTAASLTWSKENWGNRTSLLPTFCYSQALDFPLRNWRIHLWISPLVCSNSEESSFVIRLQLPWASHSPVSFQASPLDITHAQGLNILATLLQRNTLYKRQENHVVFFSHSFHVWFILGKDKSFSRKANLENLLCQFWSIWIQHLLLARPNRN